MVNERRILCVLFADVVGYSKIGDEDSYTRLESFNRSLLESTLTVDNHVYKNTWGDAFFICSGDPADMAGIALQLRDAYRKNQWLRSGFRAALQIRTGVHVETVNLVWVDDEITNVVGAHVTVVARIEPIVEPNQVYCTDRFKQHLESDAQAIQL